MRFSVLTINSHYY